MPTLLPLPPSAGKMKPSPKLQWFCKWLLARLGWTMHGEWPENKKVVIIGAPHSSAWDVVLVLLVIQATGMKVVFMGKQEVFRMPIIGSIAKYLGGMPVNRAAPGGVIEQVAEQIRNAEQMWFALAPEGTRKEVKEWKTGFWKIAKKANVPVCCAYFHFPDKVIGVGQVFELSDDMDGDIAKIRAWYKPYQGRNRGV